MQTKRSVTTTQIKKLIESQNYRCALTNRPLTPETASLDHKQPISRGGTHEVANLWVVEHFVNTAKGSLTVEEFVSMCRDVVRHQDAINTPEGADPTRATLAGAGQKPMTPLMSV
jgi:5-methylcytosine-specific restriction endonuclease McrA